MGMGAHRWMVALLAMAMLAVVGCGDDNDGGTVDPANNAENNDTNNDQNNDTNNDENNDENNDAPECGNGVCETGEDEATCPADCATPNNDTCVDDDLAPNQSPEDATSIEVGQTIENLFICPEANDFFTVEAEAGQQIAVSIFFSHADGDLDLAVFRPDDAAFENPVGVSESTDDDESVSFEAPIAGAYVIVVVGFDGSSAPYSIAANQGCVIDAECPDDLYCNRIDQACRPYVEPDCGGDGDLDPNGSDSRAQSLDPADSPIEFDNLATCLDDIDFFVIELDNGDSLSVTTEVSTTFAYLGIFLQDEEGFIVAAQTDDDTDVRTLEAPFLPAGTYHLLTVLFDGQERPPATDYTMSITVTPGACDSNDDCEDATNRPFCQEGACDIIEGDGQVALGDACDSNDDCVEGSDGCYTGSVSPEGFICTISCRRDDQCADVGEGAYCSQDEGVCLLPCQDNSTCSDELQCFEGRCGTCGDDAQCPEEAVCLLPTFGAGGLCGEAPEVACGQDDNEPNNLISEATALEFTDGSIEQAGLGLCDADFDIFTFTTDEPGTVTASVSYAEGPDLDLWIVPLGQNTEIGIGISTDPGSETAVAEFIPAGTYSLRVLQFPGEMDADTNYDLTINFEAGTCDGDEACLETGVRRLSCVEGACAGLEGNGEVELGGACDTTDDCSLDSELCFAGNPEDNFNICTITCGGDEDCAPIPGTVCTESGFFAFCLPE